MRNRQLWLTGIKREESKTKYKNKNLCGLADEIVIIDKNEDLARGQRGVFTVSTLLDGEFGLKDVCLSVPGIVSNKGMSKIIVSNLNEQELKSLSSSADILKTALKELNL